MKQVYGVDFSGAAQAGQNIWIARCDVLDDPSPDSTQRLALCSLDRLAELARASERSLALQHLTQLIRTSHESLWGIDFPFGLPIELGLGDWPDQLALLRRWTGTATDFGRHCVELARTKFGKLHIRRLTDTLTRTPFDCYHYRIIHQTFHGMRMLASLRGGQTCVFPFDSYSGQPRVVVEACPGSTLKRLGLPHQNYKQPQGKLEEKHRATRRTILHTLKQYVSISPAQVRVMNRNPGGDAIDAVIAAAGVWRAWTRLDPSKPLDQERYAREGLVLA